MHFHCRSFFNSHFFQRKKKRKETVATQKQVNSLKRLFVQILCVCVCVRESVCVSSLSKISRSDFCIHLAQRRVRISVFCVCVRLCASLWPDSFGSLWKWPSTYKDECALQATDKRLSTGGKLNSPDLTSFGLIHLFARLRCYK